MATILIEGAAEIVTLAPLARQRKLTRIVPDDLGRLTKGWLLVDDGRVAATGSGRYGGPAADRRVDAGGGLVLPGLVDAHTHPIFAGSRAREFALRADGATYQEIAAQGGGIRATMRATREASDEELARLLDRRLARALALGVTTLEAKSGYGLSVPEELRLLELLAAAKARTPQTLSVTCLALHAASPEHEDLKSYADAVAHELLPTVAKRRLADWVDAFIEAGYFSVADVEPVAARAKELGLGLRLHADEFSDAGAAAAAARWGAAAADHLQFASDAGIEAMAGAGTLAVLLPGTSLYTKLPFADARRFADRGVGVAVATDFNPGSCRLDNLAMMAGLAAVQAGLRAAEAIAAVTYVAAASLRLEDRKGALVEGHDADFLVYDLASVDEWLADFGRTPPREVWVKGRKAFWRAPGPV